MSIGNYVLGGLGVGNALSSGSPTSGSSSTTVPGSNPSACASVAQLAASQTVNVSTATPTVPANLAYDCLNSIPFNQTAASDLVLSLDPYLTWQSTFDFVKSPPAEYAEKIQAPYDFYACWDNVKSNVSSCTFDNEYQFGMAIYDCFAAVHDNHILMRPDTVGSLFYFARSLPLVSVSVNGSSLPEIYVYQDIVNNVTANSTTTSSPVTEIEGQDATQYLLALSQQGILQDPDALWNDLFYNPPSVITGLNTSSGYGVFAGGNVGKYIYPGATTNLTFQNGTSIILQNYALLQKPFENITSGEDVYQNYLSQPAASYTRAFDEIQVIENMLEASGANLSSLVPNLKGDAPRHSSTRRDDAAPAQVSSYPEPVIRHFDNYNAGYFLDGSGYEDVAVLSLQVMGGDGDVSFQALNTYFIQAARAANKTKMIIDLSANTGGQVFQAYDIFKQFFPDILPYGAGRWKSHEALDLISQQISYASGFFPRSPNDPDFLKDVVGQPFNWRSDTNDEYEPFTSWEDKYAAHSSGPLGDKYTATNRWNLSDPLITIRSNDMYVSGYLNRSNVTQQLFQREQIILVYDGFCTSDCAVFSELMRQQGGVKTIALGGRPNTDIIQPVGGSKGTTAWGLDYFYKYAAIGYATANSSTKAIWDQNILANYSYLPLARIPGAQLNFRDGLREGSDEQTPLQFMYEPADCRMFYTPEMVVDQSAVWKRVADTVWGDEEYCVAGSNYFYGPQ